MDDSAAAGAFWSPFYVHALRAVLGDAALPCECDCARCRGRGEMEEESDSDSEVDVPLKIQDAQETAEASGSPTPLVGSRVVVPEGRFLWPAPRIAYAGRSTAGIMRVVAVEPEPAAGSQEEGGKQIMVLYRYTHFRAAPEGGGRVEVRGTTKLHQLRFVVPPASDAATSLPWAGSSLAPLIYPARHSEDLQALWSRLVSKLVIPPRATRVQVIADVGILRQEDYTRWRMVAVRHALKNMMAEAEADPWPGYHVAMELQLPEPVRCADEAETANGERPAKRRKVVAEAAGQECSVCFELLESDVAVWPGCSLPHNFHGACLEETLKGSEMCPLCRRKLSALDEETLIT